MKKMEKLCIDCARWCFATARGGPRNMDKMELRRLIEHDRVLVAPHRRGKARNKKGLLLNELISRLKLFSLIIVVFLW